MVNPILILIIIVIVIFIILCILKFVKRMLHMAFSFAVIVVLVALLLYVYYDINEVNRKFYSSEKLFLLEVDGEIVAGFVSKGEEIVRTVKSSEDINQLFSTKDFKNMLADNYKLFVIKWEMFDNLESLEVEGNVLQRENIYKNFKSDRINDDLKGVVFARMFRESIDNKKLVEGLKQKKILIYKETATFKLIRILPEAIAKDFVKVQQ